MDQRREPPRQDDHAFGKDEIEGEGDERREMDDIAPPGTDPLHEGP